MAAKISSVFLFGTAKEKAVLGKPVIKLLLICFHPKEIQGVAMVHHGEVSLGD